MYHTGVPPPLTVFAPVTVSVELAVVYGHPMEDRAAALRWQLADALARHTELNITAIDVTITDVLEPPGPRPVSGTAQAEDPQTPEEKP